MRFKILLSFLFLAIVPAFAQYAPSQCGSSICAAELNSKTTGQSANGAATGTSTPGKDFWNNAATGALQWSTATNTWSGSMAVAVGKAFSVNNTLTFTGTDGSSVAFGAGGTVLYTNGNAATATALANNPADSSPNNLAVSIDTGANLTCAQPSISAGVSGLGTGVATFLGTPSGANLASAMTTPLPVSGGGTGLTTATGLVRGSGSAMSAAELTGDATTSGSNAVSVVRLNGTSLAGLATGLLKNTTGTGVPVIAAFSDIVALWSGSCSSSTYLNGAGACAAPLGSGTVNSGTATHLSYYATTTNAVSDAGADFVYNGTHTWTLGASGILDLSAASVTAGVKIPAGAGAAPTADDFIAFDTTAHRPVWGGNGSTLYAVMTADLGTGVGTFLATPSGANLASALTTALPASKGGTGLTSLGTGVATFLGTPSGTNLASALTTPLTAAGGGTGVSNTATLTLGSSNQNWATLGTGIVKNTTTTGAISDAASSDVISLWTGTCSSSTYLNGAGVCTAPSGSGTVNSGTATHLAYYATSTTAVSDAGADFTFNGTHTWTLGASGIFDLSAASVTGGLKIPSAAAAAPTADGLFAFNTTTHRPAWGGNGATLSAVMTADLGTGVGTFLATPSGANLASALTTPLPSTAGGTGVSNTASLTLGSSNVNLATLGTGIVKNTTTTGNLTDAASSDVIALWSGTCSSSTYLNGAGACAAPGGSGTVNSGTATHLAYYATSTNAVSDAGTDFTYGGVHTWTLGSAGIFDLSAASVTGGLKIPSAAGAAPTADDFIAFNTTTHRPAWGSNGSTLSAVMTADLGTGVGTFLATPSGANLASALTTPLPASGGGTGITSLGTGVATALGNAVSGSGAICLASGSSCIGAVNTVASSSTPAFNLALGNTQYVSSLATNASPTFSNISTGGKWTFIICNNSTGNFTWTWPASVHAGMTIGVNASKCSSQSFTSPDGTNLFADNNGVINH